MLTISNPTVKQVDFVIVQECLPTESQRYRKFINICYYMTFYDSRTYDFHQRHALAFHFSCQYYKPRASNILIIFIFHILTNRNYMLISREYHNTGYVKLYGKKVVLFIQNSMITIHDQSLIKNKIKKPTGMGGSAISMKLYLLCISH